MHPTYGAHQVASVTELRTDTNGLLRHAKRSGEAILLQRNSAPCGVLIGLEQYEEYLALKREHAAADGRTAPQGGSLS
jgi:antitoxin (DNA-binding transcriptional repressor) of toxin-antitoxin stability system